MRTPKMSLAIALALLLTAGFGASPTEAQEEDVVVVGADLELVGYPAGVHQGTCDSLVIEAAYPLGLVQPVSVRATDEGLAEDEGLIEDEGALDDEAAEAAEGVRLDVPAIWTAEESIERVSLGELMDISHSVVVYRGNLSDADFLACGEIGGPMNQNQLPVVVLPLGNSGFTGVAIFEESDEGFLPGDGVGVALYMYQLQPGQQGEGGA